MARIGITVLALALSAAPALAQEKDLHGGKVNWTFGDGHDAAIAQAKATGSPVMIYFTTVW